MNPNNRKSALAVAITLVLSLWASAGSAATCTGVVGYLGIDEWGDVVLSLSGSTPIHRICSLHSQGTYRINVAGCKAAYASLLAARLSGMSMVVYYGDVGLTCGSLPVWTAVPSTYFVEGPIP